MTTFGQDCKQNCSTQCLDRDCHHVTGECRACNPGYTGEFCQEECPKYTYGADCEQNCSTNCVDRLCDHVTGNCGNCTAERNGDFCETIIAQAQTNSGGDDTVVIGTVVGVTLGIILIVTIIVVFVVRSRMRRESEPFEMKQAVNLQYTNAYSPDSAGKPPRPTRPTGGTADGKVLVVVVVVLLVVVVVVVVLVVVEVEAAVVVVVVVVLSGMKIAADGPDSVYSNVLPGNTAVSVDDLRSYLNQHAADSFLIRQFESIPLANSYPQRAGLTPPNNKKNRYRNIVPYDHSRVLLQADPQKKQDDYINASYIKGYNDQDCLIAAQAPSDLTLNDFVRMIWEKKIDRIVMLTNLVEIRKVKCTQYWPVDDDQMYGEIRMSLLTTQVFAEYTVRQFRLYKTDESYRDVTQFHFTAWPDKLVPDSPWGLVDFYHRVATSPGTGPLLVHCSAGVGRTGTFIALCNLMQEAEATGKMDFLSTLWRLRQDRMSMIQTEYQYVFLHWAALVGHATLGTSFQVKNITNKLQDLGTDGYTSEFDAVGTASADDTAEPPLSAEDGEDVYQNSRTDLNKHKNRLNNILPKDAYRPELSCEMKTMGKYINAVLVPTLTKDRQDILTQLPLPSTVTDFWRLVTQYHVGLIVAFETESKETDETIGEFLPKSETEPMRGALFEIQARSQGENHLWKELMVTVFKKRKSLLGSAAQQHHVTCLICKEVDCDPQTVLEYQKKMRTRRPEEQSRTLYMCRNGAKLCGLMCVQSILLDKMEVDPSLTVPLVVGAIRAIRPQVIPTVGQYKCLYDVLKLVQDSNSVYGNVRDTRTTLNESFIKKQPSELSQTGASSDARHNRQASLDRESPVATTRSNSRTSSGFKSSPTPMPRKSLELLQFHADDDSLNFDANHGVVTDVVDSGCSGVHAMQEEHVAIEYANM
ncbi:receptor-type tyrosine-protein phosphatase kappa [Elysia marginata]|uniref:protein-tyrosine-phosphatase n=1 Tax=Elysia marginata TaxID=1093978 RepID=A0AAV4EPZ4_9GAST|nr:receptor-type tyrosine-protein phosphatase kappa [Elysia marginata]